MSQFSYLFLELAFLAGIATLMVPLLLRRLAWRRIAVRIVALFLLWVAIDVLAVRLGLWFFPAEGTLPVRVFALPVEEYLVFVIHSLVCLFLVVMVQEVER